MVNQKETLYNINMSNKNWVALFSQTGSELANICKEINTIPNLILTNKENIESIDPWLLDNCFKKIILLPQKPTLEEYNTALKQERFNPKNTFLSMHGYLRIIPKEVCNKWEIYNGHPGLINSYPELKGFDPQKRSLTYKEIGSVIHRANGHVDDGKVIISTSIVNNYTNEADITNALRSTSLKSWLKFFSVRTNFGIKI